MANRNVIAAMSYHHAILEVCGPLTLQAIFSRAWHLRHSRGWVISVASTPFDGPLGIRVVESALDALPVRPGMPARLTFDELQIGRVCIDLGEAAVWKPQGVGSPLPLRAKRLHETVSALSGPLTPLPLWERGLGGEGTTPEVESILSALMNNDLPAVEYES